MPMIETDTLALCECCSILVATGDESSCRDYYGHTHPSANVPAHTHVDDDEGAAVVAWEWTCDGCGQHLKPYAYRMWAVVLEVEHRHEYRRDISDWWCHDCEAVTDFCDQ